MNKNIKSLPAFTLLEMVFVITILGIVAAISSEVIAKSYESYINQRAIYRASAKTELVATQIANRLAYAIPGSIVARDDGINANALVGIKDLVLNNTFRTLQWIGYDRDGFTTRNQGVDSGPNRRPAWSGFADLSATQRVVANPAMIDIRTPGSNLGLLNANGALPGIIPSLSSHGTARTSIGSALYSKVPNLRIYGNANAYNLAGTPGIYLINAIPNNQTIRVNAPANSKLSEQYKIAWSSYAVVPTVPNAQGEFDLWLHYNFQPWNNEGYRVGNGNAAQRSLLLRNVTVFRFTGSENSIRFKLCQRERTGGTATSPTFVTICKEKVVIK